MLLFSLIMMMGPFLSPRQAPPKLTPARAHNGSMGVFSHFTASTEAPTHPKVPGMVIRECLLDPGGQQWLLVVFLMFPDVGHKLSQIRQMNPTSDPDSTCSPLAPLLTVPPARWESLPAVPTQLHCLRNQNTKSDSALAQMTL